MRHKPLLVYLLVVCTIALLASVWIAFQIFLHLPLQDQALPEAHRMLKSYAIAIRNFDEEGILTSICPDAGPEIALQTFTALGPEGRTMAAQSVEQASFDQAASTPIKQVYQMRLQTPVGERSFPINVLLLDGGWCIEEPGVH